MTMKRTYLDYNASAPLRREARAAMLSTLDAVGNPSSVHAEGRVARAIIETAREQVASLVNAKPSEVVFVSGATEANNWVLSAGWDAIALARFEHDSVTSPVAASGATRIDISISRNGVAKLEGVGEALAASAAASKRTLLTLMTANNETGVIQPVAEVAALAREHGACVHTDAVQAPGRIPVDFAALGVDALSLSAHKLGGPHGVGALVVRDGGDLRALIKGGGQERRRRGGTENISGIAGFGAAAEVGEKEQGAARHMAKLRDRLEIGLLRTTPTAVIIGKDAPRLANTTYVALPGKLAETLVIKLDLEGIAVSAGAACSSGKVGSSHVLEAMNLGPEMARSAVRVSLGTETKDDNITAFLKAWEKITDSAALAA